MITTPQPAAIYYPEEDGSLTESTKHLTQLTDLYVSLRAFFAPRPDVFVGGNIAMFYREGDPTRYYGPDILVAAGVRPRPMEERGSYRIWDEGVVPQVIIELLSPKTGQVDVVKKPPQYAALGVAEYYLFDPLGVLLHPRLQGYHLTASGRYERLDGPTFDSPALGLRLLERDGWLRLWNPATDALLPTPEETQAARAGLEALQHELDLLWRQSETALQQERTSRMAAEAENARLRAELARLREQNSN